MCSFSCSLCSPYTSSCAMRVVLSKWTARLSPIFFGCSHLMLMIIERSLLNPGDISMHSGLEKKSGRAQTVRAMNSKKRSSIET